MLHDRARSLDQAGTKTCAYVDIWARLCRAFLVGDKFS